MKARAIGEIGLAHLCHLQLSVHDDKFDNTPQLSTRFGEVRLIVLRHIAFIDSISGYLYFFGDYHYQCAGNCIIYILATANTGTLSMIKSQCIEVSFHFLRVQPHQTSRSATGGASLTTSLQISVRCIPSKNNLNEEKRLWLYSNITCYEQSNYLCF